MRGKYAMMLMGSAIVAAACGDATGPGASGQPSLSLSFATTQPVALNAAQSGVFANVAAGATIVSGADMLVIDQVELVLREIELERVEAIEDGCDAVTGSDDDCEEIEVGPMRVLLPLNGDVETPISVTIDAGSYDEIEFEIHKLEDNTADADLLTQFPYLENTSIRVEGTFNGRAFVYTTDLNVEQEIDLAEPLVVTDATVATNVTLRVALDQWFSDGAGGVVDPETANKGGQNESLVNENIKNSFEAFEDRDRDGDDSDEDGGVDDSF